MGPSTGEKWKHFTSLAIIPGHGPLFVATVISGEAGAARKTTSGVWVVDSTGVLRNLFKTRDPIFGKPLQSFALLQSTPGALA